MRRRQGRQEIVCSTTLPDAVTRQRKGMPEVKSFYFLMSETIQKKMIETWKNIQERWTGQGFFLFSTVLTAHSAISREAFSFSAPLRIIWPLFFRTCLSRSSRSILPATNYTAFTGAGLYASEIRRKIQHQICLSLFTASFCILRIDQAAAGQSYDQYSFSRNLSKLLSASDFLFRLILFLKSIMSGARCILSRLLFVTAGARSEERRVGKEC